MKQLLKRIKQWIKFQQTKRKVIKLLPKVLEDFYHLREMVNAPGFDLKEKFHEIEKKNLDVGICTVLMTKYGLGNYPITRTVFKLSKKTVDRLYPDNEYNHPICSWTYTISQSIVSDRDPNEGLNRRIHILEELVKKYC